MFSSWELACLECAVRRDIKSENVDKASGEALLMKLIGMKPADTKDRSSAARKAWETRRNRREATPKAGPPFPKMPVLGDSGGPIKKAPRTFDGWRREVDREVEARCGLSLDDLPDCPTMDWFNDRVSPKAAAGRAIRYAKTF